MQINFLTHFSAMVFVIYMELNKYIKHITKRKKCMRNIRHVKYKYPKLKKKLGI